MPDSAFSKYTAGLYDQFNKFAVEETGEAGTEKLTPKEGESTMGQISRMIGATVGDIGTAALTGGASAVLRGAPLIARTAEAAAPTVFNIIKQQLPQLGKAAESFAIPALRSGMQAQDMAERMGASPADQNLAFTKAALLTMGSAALPLGVESNAANMFSRFVERAAKAAPLGVAAGAATQGAENILSPGEARPFDPKQLTINAVPVALLAGALGKNVERRPLGPIAEQAFPKGGEAPAPMPGGEVKFAPKEAPQKPTQEPAKPGVAESLSGIPPKEPAFLAKKRAKLAELEKELSHEKGQESADQPKINQLVGEIGKLKEDIADDELTVKMGRESGVRSSEPGSLAVEQPPPPACYCGAHHPRRKSSRSGKWWRLRKFVPGFDLNRTMQEQRRSSRRASRPWAGRSTTTRCCLL